MSYAFNKAGEPTTPEIAEAIERMRDLLFRQYGTHFDFVVGTRGAIIAAHNSTLGTTFEAVVRQ